MRIELFGGPMDGCVCAVKEPRAVYREPTILHDVQSHHVYVLKRDGGYKYLYEGVEKPTAHS